MTNFLFGIILSVITFAIGDVAYTITLTENSSFLGGYLIFAFFTFSPVVFFGLGIVFPREEKTEREVITGAIGRIVKFGETYER